MEKGKRVEVADVHLPEAIIQHIQSFLDGKEAAQTTLLSKSWNNAWLTRPNLEFDQKVVFETKSLEFDQEVVFETKSDADSEKRFWRFVNKTVERYEKLNLRIDSFKLWIHAEHSLVIKLIIKVLKMGATGLDFKIYGRNSEFTLPPQVFGFENLTKLSVSGCKISTMGRIRCRRLKSLCLEESIFVHPNIIWDIISTCPLISNLSLSSPIERLGLIEFGKKIISHGPMPIFVNEFRKLERLFLHRIKFPPSYFDDFSSKFPSLKNLGLDRCQPYKEISISSPSLECIYLNFIKYDIMLHLKFDVPKFRKFLFSGAKVPTLSIKTTNSNWESDIIIQREAPPGRLWFLELNKLLMSLSKVTYLTLVFLSEKTAEHQGEFRGVCRPQVQYLSIRGPCSTSPPLYYSLFMCCRPMYVTQDWCAKLYIPTKRRYDFVDFVARRTAHHVAFNSCLAYQRMMAGECDLEEVDVQFYDASVSKWRPGQRLLDSGDDDERKVRLRLKWRQIVQQV